MKRVRPNHPVMRLSIAELRKALAEIYDGFYVCPAHDHYCLNCSVNGGDLVEIVSIAVPDTIKPTDCGHQGGQP